MTASRYLAFLPAVYAERAEPGDDPSAPGFIGDYLNIFEKLLTGIDDGQLQGRRGIQELLSAEVIGELFHPRFSFLFNGQTPPDTRFIPPISDAPPQERTRLLAEFNRYIGLTGRADPLAGFVSGGGQDTGWQAEFEAWLGDFLGWLGGWVALVPDRDWSLDKQRTVIAEIVALYRLRGTPQGLSMLIDRVLDLPLTVEGFAYAPDSPTPTAVQGLVSVAVSNPTPAPIPVSDQPATAFVLRSRARVDAPVVGGQSPWRFQVTLTLPNAHDPGFILTTTAVQAVLALATRLRALLERIQPAASRATLAIVPSMQLQRPARATQLGVNTLIGEQGA